MLRSRALAALLGVLLLLAPTACDDPTSVGGELIDRPGAAPKRVEVDLDVSAVQYAPVTGTSSAAALSVSRFLAGQTSGAPLGDIEATAYVDFAGASLPSSLTDPTLSRVELRLEPDYFYGDTTEAATYALYEMEEEWNGARADTTLAGDVEPQRITTFSVSPGDSLATVALPEAWARDHAGVLTADDDSAFAEDFHGFQLRPIGGGSIAGFRAAPGSGTSLRTVFEAESDSGAAPDVLHRVARQLTTTRQPDPQPVEDRYVIQDGTGRGLSFRFNFPDSLNDAALNSASLVFEVDSTLGTEPSDAFVRPQIETLNIYNATDLPETEPAPLQVSGGLAGLSLNADSARFENNFAVIDLVQNLLLENTAEDARYQLRPSLQVVRTNFGNVPVSVPSFNSTLIRSDAGHRPRLVLTYTSTIDE